MKKLVMRIKSIGCPGCIATALIHLFKIRGVKGGGQRIQSWSVEEYKGEALAGQYSLTPR
ncbi:hypothetical protein [Thermogladius sp.]|uniref:hypothetical protein n=1 Tax=Thermogladius sp. TaxID=2023064 RepID=UPI003D11120F